jgi:uncharacterized YccA/Bax inhibitor family protein
MVIFYVLGYAVHHGNSMMSIGISVFVIIIAALNLFLDFDRIEKGTEQNAQIHGMVWRNGTDGYLSLAVH